MAGVAPAHGPIPAFAPRQVTVSSAWESEPAIAPDGSMVAYVSDEAGNDDIWLSEVNGSGPPLRVTTHGARDWAPSWTRDVLPWSSLPIGPAGRLSGRRRGSADR